MDSYMPREGESINDFLRRMEVPRSMTDTELAELEAADLWMMDDEIVSDWFGSENAEKYRPPELMEELAASGVKYAVDDVVMVTKMYDGTLVWLETGNKGAGMKHIMDGHGNDFKNRGITDVQAFLLETLNKKAFKTGKDDRGHYSEYVINGKMYKVAYGTNGFIVSFYPLAAD